MMAEQNAIDILDLPEYLQASVRPEQEHYEGLLPMQIIEYRHMQRVLENVGGDRDRAADILKIGRSTLYRLLKQGPMKESSCDARVGDRASSKGRKSPTAQANSLSAGVA